MREIFDSGGGHRDPLRRQDRQGLLGGAEPDRQGNGRPPHPKLGEEGPELCRRRKVRSAQHDLKRPPADQPLGGRHDYLVAVAYRHPGHAAQQESEIAAQQETVPADPAGAGELDRGPDHPNPHAKRLSGTGEPEHGDERGAGAEFGGRAREHGPA